LVSSPPPSPPSAVSRTAFGSLVVLGLVVGVFTGFQATRLLYWGPLHVSVGGFAALVLNVLFGGLAAWGLTSREAALMPGIGWFIAVLGLLFLPHPGGDIVLPGSGGDAIAFLLLGIAGTILAAMIATRIVPPRALPGRPTRR
jgi:hypothetical protein